MHLHVQLHQQHASRRCSTSNAAKGSAMPPCMCHLYCNLVLNFAVCPAPVHGMYPSQLLPGFCASFTARGEMLHGFADGACGKPASPASSTQAACGAAVKPCSRSPNRQEHHMCLCMPAAAAQPFKGAWYAPELKLCSSTIMAMHDACPLSCILVRPLVCALPLPLHAPFTAFAWASSCLGFLHLLLYHSSASRSSR